MQKIFIPAIAALVLAGAGCSKSYTVPSQSSVNTTASYTMSQVAEASSQTKCWTAIDGKVYDLTAWISQHPGGEREILSICGKDGTGTFIGQHGGQGEPAAALASFQIGILAQ